MKLKNRTGAWKNRTFVLDYDYDPAEYIDNTKRLLVKLLENAKNDYLEGIYSEDPVKRSLYHYAKDFLFDDTYTFQYGDKVMDLQTVLDYIYMGEISKETFREGINKKAEEKKKEINGQLDLL